MQRESRAADGNGSEQDNDNRRAMRGPLRALALMILLLQGSGGGGVSATAAGFVNQTQHTDAELWVLCKAAQQNLSQQIDLNPLQRALSNVPAQILPGDPRVWNVQPLQLVVAARQDVSS